MFFCKSDKHLFFLTQLLHKTCVHSKTVLTFAIKHMGHKTFSFTFSISISIG